MATTDECKNELIAIKNANQALLAELKKVTAELKKLNLTIGGN